MALGVASRRGIVMRLDVPWRGLTWRERCWCPRHTGPPLHMYGESPYTEGMTTVTLPTRDARLDLRMTADNRALISQAAQLNGTSLTDYVMSVVVRAARQDVLQARLLHLDPDAWDDFMAALDEPDTDAMAALRTRATRWDGPAQ